VDLAAPVFRPVLLLSSAEKSLSTSASSTTRSSEYYLTKPFKMDPKVYQQALQMLNVCAKHHTETLKLTSDQISHLSRVGYIDPDDAATNAMGKPAFDCVTRCPAGQLRVYGGLIVYPGCQPLTLRKEFMSLNAGQQAAVRRILQMEDYALLLGLPGTGKTSTLSLVVRMMIARGQKVLLTSFTHSAVDGLLGKLSEAGLGVDQVLRIGAASYVHSSSHRFMLSADRGGSSLSAMKSCCDNIRLVACTVLTAARCPFLKAMCIDCCVMDEAGQITQLAAIGAILHARSCVLVGDDNQLPPLVVSAEAQKRGMDVSLFKRLMEAHPTAVSRLCDQYRMNDDIMSLCNHLIYSNAMKCGDSSIARARISLSYGREVIHRSHWLHFAIQPNPAVLMIDTDGLAAGRVLEGAAPSSKSEGRVVNRSEAAVVCSLLRALRQASVDLQQQVGVISPYKAQVGLIRQMMMMQQQQQLHHDEHQPPPPMDCEVSTVDQFQGRDKDIVILSTVRSLCPGSGGSSPSLLLRDWRRINVAITRYSTLGKGLHCNSSSFISEVIRCAY
jgi:DNA replication ATP-dependent helicase Dna2